MQFLYNMWYVGAYSTEVGEDFLARQMLGKPILLYRKQNGEVAAISNICPHRFAPLNRGLRIGDAVECPYHGMQFGPDGTCVVNPHTDKLDRKMDVSSYPVVEQYGMVWIWMGDEQPDRKWIPDMSAFENAEGRSICRSYLETDYRYDILVDNLLDLSHGDYLHRGSFSSGAGDGTGLTVTEAPGDAVVIDFLQRGCDPPPFMPDIDFKLDMLTRIRWNPTQAILFHAGFAPAGVPIQELNGASFYHIATPASADKTHYFMGVVRDGELDEEADRALGELQRSVIAAEDGPMLEFVHDYMSGRELMDMQPLILPVDAGGLKARRVMKRMLESEQSGA